MNTNITTSSQSQVDQSSFINDNRYNQTSLILTSFLAILRRDIVITGRDFGRFLVQVLLQPLFYLFVFGKVLPGIGLAQQNFPALLLPGILALTIVTTAFQGVTVPLVLDLGFAHEIDDRLLAPLPINLVGIEKVVFGALQGLIAGVIIFPCAYLILGSGYQVRTDEIGLIVSIMLITAIAGASLGLTVGTLFKPEQLGLMFSIIFTPLIFTGCTYYPWSSLNGFKWFQIVTLFNPMTYASEGLRSAMVPIINGQSITTLLLSWVFLGLCVTCVLFLAFGLYMFHRRVVS
jgi:ABC-2 type transport system permease protein